MGKIVGKDIVRSLALKLLRGYTVAELASMSAGFYANFLTTKRNKEVDSLLKGLSADAILYFVSSSIEPVISIVAKAYQANYFSSELLYDGQRFTGKLVSDLTGKKHQKVAQLAADFSKENITVITDNFTDKELVAMAGRRYVVINNKSDRNFWKELHPEFIYA